MFLVLQAKHVSFQVALPKKWFDIGKQLNNLIRAPRCTYLVSTVLISDPQILEIFFVLISKNLVLIFAETMKFCRKL